MAKEPMNNWVLEVEKLQERMDKVEAKLSGAQPQQVAKPAPAPAPGSKKDH
jgi:hypothetical protein